VFALLQVKLSLNLCSNPFLTHFLFYLIETFGETNQKKERVFKIQQEASAVFEAAKPKETTPRRKLFASLPPSFLTFGVVCNDALQNDGSRISSPATSLPDSN